MARLVKSGGRLWGRSLFDPLPPEQPTRKPRSPVDPPGTIVCPQCDGAGVVVESIDEERADVLVPCPRCQEAKP